MPTRVTDQKLKEKRTMEEGAVLTEATIGRWITVYVATLLGLESETIDPAAPLASYDLDSVDAVEMALRFESTFGRPIHPETFMDGSKSISALAEQLADR